MRCAAPVSARFREETGYRPLPSRWQRQTNTRQDWKSAVTEECNQTLGRTERRLLRRIYNGRTVPIIVDGRPFLTYQEASRYLLSLSPDARTKAYGAMKSGAVNTSEIVG
jgi:hypothetical protein